MDEYIVILEPGVFLADGEGDPPRVCDIRNAKVFPSLKAATSALADARKFRPFECAEFFIPSIF